MEVLPRSCDFTTIKITDDKFGSSVPLHINKVNLMIIANPFIRIVGFGHNFDDGKPISGWRSSVFSNIYKLVGMFITLQLGINAKRE